MKKYEDGIETYRNRDEIRIERHEGTGLISIPKLGISARALSINGMPVALEYGSSIYCSPDTIEHCPIAYTAGLLALKTE